MRPWSSIGLAAGCLLVGFAVGRHASPWGVTPGTTESLRTERDEAKTRAERAETELAQLREPRHRPRDQPAGAVPPDSRVPSDPETVPAAPAAKSPEAAPKLSPEARRARVIEIRANLHTAFESHDGEKALQYLKELASLGPEGRDDAMKLALDINSDVEGAGELRLPQQQFYVGLGDPALCELMSWSLENQASSPADFRVLSVWSLPWVLPSPDATISQFVSALSRESDRGVQNAIVRNLGAINSSKAEAALVAVLGNASADPDVRGDAAMALAASRDPAVWRALDLASVGPEASARIATAQKVSLVYRDPPTTGLLVVVTQPGAFADVAGLHAADVIVSYDAHAVRSENELRQAVLAVTGTDTVPVTIVRDAQQQTIQVKPGRLDRGVDLRPVVKK